MIWATILFVVYLIELLIWAYVAYLHFEEKIMKEPKYKYPQQVKVVVKTKKDIVRG